jgi:TFIIS helical bundle-like domain
LHLLTSIEHLPVTKASIKDSGLGKAVGAVEKHKICKSSPHATAIVQRVERIKQAWHARVKSQKINESSSTETNELKRPIESSNTSPASVKKMKQVPLIEEKKITTITEEKKNLSFSNLLKKVAAPSSNGTSTSSNPASANKIAIANANLEKTKNNAPTSVSTIAATKKGKLHFTKRILANLSKSNYFLLCQNSGEKDRQTCKMGRSLWWKTRCQ